MENLHGGHRHRLRRSYIEGGAAGMHDHQLLELLLTFAIPRRDTNPIAHSLLGKSGFGSLAAVLNADPQELMAIDGIGESAAVLLSLVGALSKKTLIKRDINNVPVLMTPGSAMSFCKSLPFKDTYESMYLICMDKKFRVINYRLIGVGSCDEVSVYPRVIVECALKCGAQNVVISHNHPSGVIRPSVADYSTTLAVMEALKAVNILLCDHVIVSGGSAHSISQEIDALFSLKPAASRAADKDS